MSLPKAHPSAWPDGLAKAETAFANLRKCAWIEGERPGYARAFNRFTGQVTDPSLDLYDHACVLLALAWLLKATGKDMYRTHIAETLHAVDVTLAAPHGGWAEDSENTTPRRQNPHMHFFEACLALVEVTGEPAHIARAGELFGLFKSGFYDTRIEALNILVPHGKWVMPMAPAGLTPATWRNGCGC
jgi:mannose/cellobiose epimerase-like protein (N-acyl-D-glucosamine 2-epimerase family)